MTNENNNKAQQLREEDEAKLKQDLINFYPKADTMKITTTTSTSRRERRTRNEERRATSNCVEPGKRKSQRKKPKGKKATEGNAIMT